MKRFMFQFFGFLALLILFSLLIDYLISNNLKSSHEYPAEFEVWNDIYNGKATCELAVYGSSRAWVHVDPAIVTKALGLRTYNFGIDGHNFNLQYMRHLEFTKHNPWPKVILLALDVTTFSSPDGFYQKEQILPYMLWNCNLYTYSSLYDGFATVDYVLPMARYYNNKSSIGFDWFSTTADKTYRNNGFKGIERDFGGNPRDNHGEYYVGIDTTTVQLFERFIDECQQHGTRLVLVYPPEYVHGQKCYMNREQIIDTYITLASKHDVEIIDYSNHRICRQMKYFYNSSHLNAEGAKVFSNLLCNDLQKGNEKLF